MYKLMKKVSPEARYDVVLRIADGMIIPCIQDNTDYQQFLQHLAQGLPVESVDGTVMTQSEIAALYQTLAQPNT